MNNDKKIELLKIWQEVSKNHEKAISAYMDLTLCPIEAPHIDTTYRIIDEYTNIVAELTGVPFDELLCWANDLHYGEIAAYEITVDCKWRTYYAASTIEELFWIWVAIKGDKVATDIYDGGKNKPV